MARAQASNAVVKSVAYGSPAALVGGYVAFRVAQKYGIPMDVASSAIAMLASWTASLIVRLSRGGRKGDPS